MTPAGPADGGHRVDSGHRAESARAEPASAEPARAEPAAGEPGRGAEPGRSEPARTEQARGDQARTARTALADFLRDSVEVDAAVEAAFRQVPRHLFVPELQPPLAYQDESVVVKVGDDGMPLSSSSQPTMMAIMLDQLGLQRGHRVLEIGAGTGYNAALMAHIVGETGSVVTVDIDGELTARASASLAAAGYGQVHVACADGALGFPGRAPYDRVILTVGAWDIAAPWLEQLATDGLIVLPLSVRGLQMSVALERVGEYLRSRSAVRCAFIRMTGALAGPEVFLPAGPQPGLRIETDDGRALDAEAVYEALAGPAAEVAADMPGLTRSELGDADLWLTLAEPELVRVTLLGDGSGNSAASALRSLGGLAETARPDGRLGLAALALGPSVAASRPAPGDRAAAGRLAADRMELLLCGYGSSGTELAGYLAARAGSWHRLGRPGITDLRLRVYPAGSASMPTGQVDGELVFRRPHATLALDWRPAG